MNTSLIGDLSSHYSSYLSYAAFLVGVLAILVTVLICWQIFNYVFIKKEMNYIGRKVINEISGRPYAYSKWDY